MAKKFDVNKFLEENKSLFDEKKKFNWKIILYAAFALIAILLIYAVMTAPQSDKELEIEELTIDERAYTECTTNECFIDAANEGVPANIETKVSTITMLHTIEEPGIYTKTVIDVDPTEPQEIQDLFLGASMTCTYTPGEFDPDYITMISGNIVPCEGTLVDAILAVIA